jgi:acetyltransferase-like isoleucine patch superfamily enzyme
MNSSVITPDVELGKNVVIHHPDLVNLYGCRIGDESKIAAFVEIQRGAVLGRRVKVEAFVFIPTGVTIEDGVFIGPHVCFSNDRYPSSVDESGELLQTGDWQVVSTLVRRRASIGANATIVCGVTVGEGAMVGAGATVTHDVPPDSLVVGNPARLVGPRPKWWSRPPVRSRKRRLNVVEH